MNFYTDDKTIIACSTGTQSNTAIAVLRLSGFKNLIDLQNFFSFDLSKTINRKSHLTNIIFEDKIFDNGLLVFFPEGSSYTGDNVLEVSVHGNQLNIQRILELFVNHGDCRSAAPGEFTYRALKNKKLSLSQVEGLDMLLNANSSLMLSQGLDILQGDLHAQYLALYDAYLKLKAAVEISIDFSEDVGVEETQKLFEDSFKKFFKLISALKTRTEGNISSLLSPEIVLVGQTNAGKSSLFNLLLKHDRSIVSNIAGTTRDYVSEVIHIDGTNFKLVDTAGIRESNDVIENIGIDRAMNILSRSFYKILIVNPYETNAQYLAKFSDIDFDFLVVSHSDKLDFDKQISKVNFSKIRTKNIAKADFNSIEGGSIEPLVISGPMGPLMQTGSIGPSTIVPHPNSESSGPIEPVSTKNAPIEPVEKNISPIKNEKEGSVDSKNSAHVLKSGSIEPASINPGPIEPKHEKNNLILESGLIGPMNGSILNLGPIGPNNIDSKLGCGPIGPSIGPIEPVLKSYIIKKFDISTANNPILLERHRDVINKIHSKSIEFDNNINGLTDVAILSSEVNILGHSLTELIGIVSPDDVLNSIFANFCIGK
jgi:tRNA modification GTPase